METTRKNLALLPTVLGDNRYRYTMLFGLAGVSAVLELVSIGLLLPLVSFVIGAPTNDTSVPSVPGALLARLPQTITLEYLAIGLVVIFILKAVSKFMVEYSTAKITNQIRGSWMTRLFEKYIGSHYFLFIREKQGTLLHNLFDLTVECLAGLKSIITLFLYAISSSMVLAVLASISWRLTVLSLLVTGGAYWLINRPLVARATHLGQQRLRVYQQTNVLPAEAFRGIREIKTYAAEAQLLQRYHNLVARMVKLRIRINFYQILPGVVPETLLAALLATVLIFLHRRVGNDLSLYVPVMATYAYALLRLFMNASALLKEGIGFLTYWPSLNHLAELLQATTYQEVSAGQTIPPHTGAALALQNVSFVYAHDRLALRDITARCPRNSITAVIGDSGAGKSTFIDLLIRLIEPTEGHILYDGQDIQQYRLKNWRSLFGYVSQDTFLFHGTIRENILFGLPSSTSTLEMEAAAQAAHADEFIARLPQGYDTVVGERGAMLSGGQRQRIAIARALVRNPGIILFDEATSALDSKNEAHMLETIQELKHGRIIILVTHRLFVAAQADQVLVLQNGQLAEAGSPDDLLRAKGAYARLYHTQAH